MSRLGHFLSGHKQKGQVLPWPDACCAIERYVLELAFRPYGETTAGIQLFLHRR